MIEQKYSEDKFKVLFDNSPIGMALIDCETGNFLEVNQYLLDSTGYTKDEFIKLSFWDLTPKEYKEQEFKQIEDLNNNGKFGPNEKEYIKKDGTRFHIKTSGFSLVDENGKKIIWNLIEDIEEKKQYEIIYNDNKELLEVITIENNLQKILDKIVNLAEKRNPHILCSILLLDKSGKHLINGSAPSLPDFYNDAIHGVEIGENVGSCGSAAFKKQRVIVDNIDTHENWQAFLELTNKANLHACWSEPIISSSNEVLGTFAIYNTEPKSPSEFEIMLIETYANTISKAIEKNSYTQLIQENENKLQQLFNNSQSGLLYIDENRKLIKANKRFADILAYESPEEMIGLSMEAFHLSHERFVEFGKKNFFTLITNQQNFNIEYELKRKDGSSIWCELAGKAFDDKIPADLSKGVLWTIQDISLKKKYQLELNEKQLLLKNILMTIPDMMWLKDINGVYLTCNPEFEKFFGKKEKDIIGKTDYDFVDKELADFFRLNDKKALNSNKVLMNEEWVVYASDKRKVLLETLKTSIRNSKNEIIGVLGIGHDVTNRNKREVELKKANELAVSLTNSQQVLLSLFDKGDSVLFKCKNDKQWTLEYASESLNKLLEVKKEDLISNKISLDTFIHKDDVARVKKEVKNAIKKNLDFYRHEPYRILVNKTEKWMLEHTGTQKDENGNITHFISYILDITEQVKNQELMFQQSKIASLGEMLGNISHQWRQPLSIISTTATGTKLKREIGIIDEKELIENMDSINESAQYLSKTIDDFRSFFLSDSSSKKEVQLQDTIHKVVSLIKDSYKSSNIGIIKVYNQGIDTCICNENLLIQALINIFNNAKDALQQNKQNSINKYVFIELQMNEDKHEIIIKDNAGGIKKENIEKVFEPYFTTKHQSQGTGIGLYMTSQIISKHLKGSISVENSNYTYLGKNFKGASFKITF